jgi:hypothetical protein
MGEEETAYGLDRDGSAALGSPETAEKVAEKLKLVIYDAFSKRRHCRA